MNRILLFLILALNTLSSVHTFPKSFLDNIFQYKSSPNPEDLYLKEWLNKLVIDLPNDLIKNETKGYIEDLTIYNISLENLITTRPKKVDDKFGLVLTIRNAALNIKGKYIFISDNPKNFLAKISSLTVKLPFYLIKNESGLVTQVDTSGFSIDIDNAQIELDLDVNELLRNIVVEILKTVLKLIKKDVIEKNFIEVLNIKLTELFGYVNDIIVNGVNPKS